MLFINFDLIQNPEPFSYTSFSYTSASCVLFAIVNKCSSYARILQTVSAGFTLHLWRRRLERAVKMCTVYGRVMTHSRLRSVGMSVRPSVRITRSALQTHMSCFSFFRGNFVIYKSSSALISSQ